MADEVPVALKLPKELHSKIKALAPSRGASAWMIRALEHVAAHPEILESRGIPKRIPQSGQGRRGDFSREVTPVWKKGK